MFVPLPPAFMNRPRRGRTLPQSAISAMTWMRSSPFARPGRCLRTALCRAAIVLVALLGAVPAEALPDPASDGGDTLAKVEPAAPQPQLPSPECRRYRAELASIQTGASATRALQDEIGRLQTYFRSLNCEGGKFLFFDTRPPQCGAVEQRIRALNATYGGAVIEDTSGRKRDLQALVARTCPARDGVPMGESYARGGGQVICVRTCDGGYFPMPNLPEGRGGADDMCHALCPGTEAVAYSMPQGDEALKQAATVKGNRAYTSLANAFKFRKSFVPNCSCKPDGKTWAQSLVKAESMLVRHKGDIFVTPMQAEALSRPKVRLTLVGRADRTAAELAADAAGRSGLDGNNAVKAGPAGLPGEGAARADEASQGDIRKGEHIAVRVIAPDLVAVPGRPTP
ncbi:hypothetical protein KHHGKMAE_3372 [Methylobacterium persicinum]|nr:hypothetical protein KHHGKMAE_3372 [Methylobacterium persicinum]